MANITFTQISADTLGRRLRTLTADIARRYAQRRLYRQTVRELAALSPRELDDLGLSRSDITRVARQSTGL